MGKKPTPSQVEWQRAARERLLVVLARQFGDNQARLANALGVSHALVGMVVRSVQPPSRGLVARLAALDGVNPHWAAGGVGEPFGPDARGSLPVSDGPLPGPPADCRHLFTGGRFAVAACFDRPACYYARLPAGHPAVAVAAWGLLPGDLLLLDASAPAAARPATLAGKMVVLDGARLGRAGPLYGAVTADSAARLAFGDPEAAFRLEAPTPPPAPAYSPPVAPPLATGPHRRRNVRFLADQEEKAEGRAAHDEAARAARALAEAADPWLALPPFAARHVLAVQLLMVRP